MHSYLTENQFFAPVSTFMAITKCESVLIEAHENYQKRGFRNRCITDSAQGPLILSIPLVKGKNERMPIKEVAISYHTDWKRLHLQSIRSSYGNAPYFEHIYPAIADLYQQSDKYLFDFNLKIWLWAIEFIELDVRITETNCYEKEIDNSKIIDARNQLKPNNYTLLQTELSSYAQVFEEKHSFLPNLSILDLIFCTGKASLSYLS